MHASSLSFVCIFLACFTPAPSHAHTLMQVWPSPPRPVAPAVNADSSGPIFAEVVVDAKGMPRCLQNPALFYDSYVLAWRQAKQYGRDVYAVPSAVLPNQIRLQSCEHWQSMVDAANQLIGSTAAIKIVPLAAEFRGFRLTAFTQEALNQLRTGAQVFRPEPTAELFLRHHPEYDKAKFDRALNFKLARRYGLGWAGTIYKTLRDERPRNAALKRELLQKLASGFNAQAYTGRKSLREKFKGYHFVFSKGYLEDPKTSRVQTLIGIFTKAGLTAESFDVDSTGAVSDNTEIVAKELRARLKAGQRMVLIGVSKGVPEILAAMAMLHDEVESAAKDHSAGRIEAVLSLSGTIGGSFLVDWATDFPQWLVIKNLIEDEANRTGIKIANLYKSFSEQGVGFLGPYMQRYGPQLPPSPIYFEAGGALTGDGLAPDSFLNQLERERLDSWIFPLHAGNDGFIEYPGTQIPQEWVPKLWQITFFSSHEILDGRYESYSMKEPETRERVIAAILDSLWARISLYNK